MNKVFGMLSNCPNGHGVQLMIQGNDLVAKKVGPGDLVSLLCNTQRTCVFGLALRTGVAFFQRYLELTHYQPCTEREELLELYYYILDDLPCVVISVPAEDEALLTETAEATRMVLKLGLQTFSIPADDGPLNELLPLPERVLTLENCEGHLVYTDAAQAEIQQQEDIERLEAVYFSVNK